MKKLYWLILSLTLGWLSGCSMLPPVKVDTQTRYVLDKLPTPNAKKSPRHITVYVADPDTVSAYNTTKIAYRTYPQQIAYFAKNSWAEQPGDMLQPLIIQALQNTHVFHAVIAPPSTGNYNYILNTQLQELLQDYSHGHARMRMAVRAEIVRAGSDRVVAVKRLTVTKPINQISPYSGVVAANQATVEILRELSQFCLRYMN